MSHTPGPWHWSDRYPMVSSGEKTWSLIGEDGYGILSCDGVENSPQGLNDEANARLIAAAPDLLEAIQGIRSFVEMFNGDLTKIDAAIAKATGESHEA